MAPLFLDTGYIIALEATDDQIMKLHQATGKVFRNPYLRLITTSYIFDEIVTFFNSRNRHAKAMDIGERLLSSPSIQFIHVDEALFFDTWKLFKQRKDKSYSLTDCISFLVMRKFACEEALSFDKHFHQEGFTLLPKA